ncbi:MAG: carbohydrate ABC transporter permease [Armatimonadota bacterium]|nr:carbohydrate ABC transporter permease [Armatimonadota bacterium]
MTLRKLGLYAAALLLSAWVLVPILLIALAATTPREDLYRWPRPLWPERLSLEVLSSFARQEAVLRALGNSLAVAGLTIVLATLVSAPAGYALSRYRFRGREAVHLGILATKMFPATALAVPLAVAFIRWGLYDTLFGVALVHTALSLPFVILIVASVFRGVPAELEEAAMSLGASRVGAFLRVTLPMALPGLAAAAIFTFILSWNEVFAATLLTVNHRTLPALLVHSVVAEGAPLHYRYAGGLFLVLPALVIIFVIRRYLLTLWGVTVR